MVDYEENIIKAPIVIDTVSQQKLQGIPAKLKAIDAAGIWLGL